MAYIIHSIEGNRQRLDGGAMFGNVPRPLWSQWIAPDDQHRIELACRAFLIHDTAADRRILLETGIGVFFEPKLQQRFGVLEPQHQLLFSLAQLEVEPEAIDLVVLSHLHFDHAGGLLTPWRPDAPHELVFPRARYLVSQQNWARAQRPHQRDRASFIPQILELLEQSGRLELVEGAGSAALGPDFHFHRSDGHTPGMMLCELRTAAGAVVFCGDLIPGQSWVHLPVTMGYDRYPERLIDEKERLLREAVSRPLRLLLTHDPLVASCEVVEDPPGRFRPAAPMDTICGLTL